MTTQVDDRSLVQHTGWAYWPVAFLARLPFAMMVVGVLTYVATQTGSVALAGLASASLGVGTVAAGPLVGGLVDRHGQRRVLLPIGIANGLLLAAFILVVPGAPHESLILDAAAAIGATSAQSAAMSRSRLIAIIEQRLGPHRRTRTYNAMMSYESAADEIAFVIGPFLVGLLASFVAPWLPLVIAAGISLVFVSLFALHPTGRLRALADGDEARAPLREIVAPGVLVVVAGCFAVGMFFGATLTSVTAFAQEHGEGSEGGMLYGLMGLGSAVLALAVALLPRRFAMRWRWLAFAAVLCAASVGYAFAADFVGVTVALLIMGLGVGPVLVTLFSLAGYRAPRGRTATVLTMVGAALTLAQALTSAVTGAVAEAFDARTSMLLPLVATSLLVVFGLANLMLERRARRRA